MNGRSIESEPDVRPTRAGAGTRLPVLLALAASILAITAVDVPARSPITDPRPFGAGHVQFYPLFGLEIDRTDNLFASQADPVPTAHGVASAGLRAEIPIRRSSTSIQYVAQYEDYDNVDLESKDSHFLDFESELLSSSGMLLGLAGELQSGAFDTRTFDPGGEATFLGDPYRRWGASVEIGRRRSNGRTVSLVATHRDLEFRRAFGDPGVFFDSVTNGARLRGEHGGDVTRWIWTVQFDDAERSRPSGAEIEVRGLRGWTGWFGFRRTANSRTSLEVLGAWTDHRFRRGSLRTTYEGALWRLRWTRGVPRGLRLEVRAERGILPSLLPEDDFYVSDRLAATIENDPAVGLLLGLSVEGFFNDYPSGGTGRRDELVEAETWMGYRFRSGLQWELFVRGRSRESTAPERDFDEVRVGTRLRFGI